MHNFKYAILLITLVFFSCMGVMEEQKSEIQPLAELIPKTKRILLGLPIDTANISRGGGTINFSFNSQEAEHASLLIFSVNPTTPINYVSENGIADMGVACVGGASDMASHAWNNSTITLTAGGTSEVYTCDMANAAEPLSKVTKVTFTLGFFPNGTYYWAILGYDSNYFLTYSSALRSFTVIN